MLRKLRPLILVCLCVVAGWAQSTAPEMSAAAREYLTKVLDLIEQGSIKRNTDWTALRRDAFAAASTAQTTADTYPAIRAALKRLGDNHSNFWTPADVKQFSTGRSGGGTGLYVQAPEGVVTLVMPNSPAARAGLRTGDLLQTIDGEPVAAVKDLTRRLLVRPSAEKTSVELTVKRGDEAVRTLRLEYTEVDMNRAPEGKLLADGIGYVELPTLGGGGAMMQQYAEIVQNFLRDFEQKPLRGWIVDLRRNGGGNMWPMLAGIGPLVGEGDVGGFTTGSAPTPWSYRDGKAMIATQTAAQAKTPYRLQQAQPFVAVLTSGQTASSGEAIVVAFRGRAKTRFFGAPTRGLPTANQSMPLSDGAMLILTVSLFADRTGKSYDDKIPPDEAAPVDWSQFGTEQDPAIKAATQWLKSQREAKEKP